MALDWFRGVLGSPEFTAFVLTAFTGAVTAFVGWIAVMIRRNVLHSLSATDLALLRSIATVAVQYAEQKFAEADGPAKLAAALQVADTYLVAYGLSVTAEQLQAIVEAAVYAETAKTSLPDPALLAAPAP